MNFEDILKTAEQGHAEAQETVKMKKIPITKLRNFYDSLKKLSSPTEAQLCILKNYNTDSNYTKLIDLYKESKKDFFEYKNIDEPFLPSPQNLEKRKRLPVNVVTISSDEDVISVLLERNPEIDVGDKEYNFKYIEREVPTCRTPKTKSEAGIRESGAGGIDFIGFNCKNHLPILGEIKVKGDQNAFYALIQLLMYLAQLSTPNQLERIGKHNFFKNDSSFTPKTSFYLYILLVFTKYGKLKDEILTETQKLAEHLEQGIQEIEKIVFLKMHHKDKIITII